VAGEPPAPEKTPAVISPATGKGQSERTPINEVQAVLRRGRELLARGDFDGALREDQKALSLSGGKASADEALFCIGLVYAHSGNPKKDHGKALGSFRRLAKEHPDSPWAEPAKAWIALIQENEKLSEMIEKSKQVDIEIEEKRKRIR
jgi:tetratricopeptide (TPR) repeat protein